MMVLGVDPGLTGALAFFDPDTGLLIVRDMPTVEVVRNGKKKNEISPQMLANLVREHNVTAAFVERVGAMPGQGVSSVFSFGRSLGIVEGVLAALELSTTIIPPQTWQKAVNLRGGKDGSRARAAELFPRDAGLFARKKDDGRADAALIAWTCATKI